MGSAGKDWETLLAEATAKGSDVTSGVVLMAVDRKGDYYYDKVSGTDSLEADAKPLTKDAIMWTASCTKLLASICALQCVERGQIGLDDPVGTVIPELATRDVVSLDPSSPDGFKLTPAKNPVTLRTLLTHTAGFAYEWGDPRLAAWRKKVGALEGVDKGLMNKVYDTPLLFEPGEGWAYGGSIDWAGILVGRLNGTTLHGYMEENIFKPLGMDSTTFFLSTREDLLARLMKSGKREADGSLTAFKGPIFPPQAIDSSGGGGLWSSAADYIKVLKDLVSETPKLLKKETIVNMLGKGQITNNDALKGLLQARGAIAANAAAANVSLTDLGVNYGLGGLVLSKDTDVLPAGTLSWGGLPNLKWFVNHEKGIAGLYFTQVMPHGDAKNIELSNEFFKFVIKLHETK